MLGVCIRREQCIRVVARPAHSEMAHTLCSQTHHCIGGNRDSEREGKTAPFISESQHSCFVGQPHMES